MAKWLKFLLVVVALAWQPAVYAEEGVSDSITIQNQCEDSDAVECNGSENKEENKEEEGWVAALMSILSHLAQIGAAILK